MESLPQESRRGRWYSWPSSSTSELSSSAERGPTPLPSTRTAASSRSHRFSIRRSLAITYQRTRCSAATSSAPAVAVQRHPPPSGCPLPLLRIGEVLQPLELRILRSNRILDLDWLSSERKMSAFLIWELPCSASSLWFCFWFGDLWGPFLAPTPRPRGEENDKRREFLNEHTNCLILLCAHPLSNFSIISLFYHFRSEPNPLPRNNTFQVLILNRK